MIQPRAGTSRRQCGWVMDPRPIALESAHHRLRVPGKDVRMQHQVPEVPCRAAPARGGMKRSRHFSRSPLKLPVNHGSEVVRAPVPAAAGWPRLQMALIVAPDRCGRIPCLVPAAPGRHRRDVASLPDGRVAGLWRVPAAGVDLDRWRWATYWRDCRRMWAVAAHRLACRACRNRDGGGYACRIRSGRCSACCCFSPYWAGSRRNACRVRAICCRSSRGVRLAPSYRLDPPRFQRTEQWAMIAVGRDSCPGGVTYRELVVPHLKQGRWMAERPLGHTTTDEEERMDVAARRNRTLFRWIMVTLLAALLPLQHWRSPQPAGRWCRSRHRRGRGAVPRLYL